MDESSFMLVFFDTFSHGQKPEMQLDSVKFSQPVKIGLIRVVPFGVAIESEIDNEARLGVTHPQVFNIKLFAHKHTESPAFEKIGEIDFDEKNGVNSIYFPAMPLASILAVSGCYNMLSIAVFGIISPHALNNIGSQASALYGPNTSTFSNSNNPIGFRSLLGSNPNALNLLNQAPPLISSDNAPNTPNANVLMSLALAVSTNNTVNSSIKATSEALVNNNTTSNVIESDIGDNIKPDQNTVSLYEDGEIQDIDYEDVSSNEDLLFGMDDTDFMGIEAADLLNKDNDMALQSVVNGSTTTAVKKISTGFPDLDKRLMTERWRFLPKRIVLQDQLLSDLKVIPNSSKTLFEVEFDRLCREEHEQSQDATFRENIDDNKIINYISKSVSNINVKHEVKENDNEAIPDSADILINLVSNYDQKNLNAGWVEEMEKLPKILAPGLAYLTYADKQTAENVIESLVSWTKVGIDPLTALKQSKSLYILRHIKAGVSLAGYMCTLDSSISQLVMSHQPGQLNVQHGLIDLLESPLQVAVAVPLQLQIIRALDLTTRLGVGLDAFVSVRHHTLSLHLTPYQRLLRFMMRKGVNSRVNMACSRLLGKLHLYEVLLQFQENIQKLKVHFNESTESSNILSESNLLLVEIIRYFVFAREMTANPRKSMPCSSVYDVTLHKPHNPYPNILHMFHITRVLDSVDWILAQSLNVSFSAGSKLDRESRLLVDRSLKLLREMAQRHESLVYLMSNPDGCMDRLLCRLFGLKTGINTDTTSGLDTIPVVLTDGASPQPSDWLDLGVELAYKLEALRWVDELLFWCKSVGGLRALARDPTLLEDAQLAGVLLGLAKLAGERRGAAWVAQVMSLDDNLAPVLPLLEALEKKMLEEESKKLANDEAESKQDEKGERANSVGTAMDEVEKTRVPLPHSICLHYLPNLLCSVLRHADNTAYLGKYGARLARLGSNDVATLTTTTANATNMTSNPISTTRVAGNNSNSSSGPFGEARDWLQPLADMPTPSPLDAECLGHLVDHLRASVTEVDAATVPPALVTVLRLLRDHMGLAAPAFVRPSSDGTSSDDEIDLYALPSGLSVDCVRFKYAITEFYHMDGLPVLIKLLQQISDHHQLSWQCGIEHIDNRYPLLLCVAEPACAIVSAVTKRLISSRKQYFKDTTNLQALFSCYTIFCSDFAIGHHHTSSCRYLAQIDSIRKSILDTILAYTQSQLPEEENEKARNAALDRSLWTCMLKELLNFTMTAPYTFIGGLMLLIELLPLPLPVKTSRSLNKTEIDHIKGTRTLWTAHLLCCRQEIRDLIHVIGCSSNQSLVELLTRFIVMVSDLDPAAASMVARGCTEKIIDVWESANQELERHNERINQQFRAEGSGNSGGASTGSGDDVTANTGIKLGEEVVANKDIGRAKMITNSCNILKSGDTFLAIDTTPRHHPDSLELTRTFALFRILLSVPTCKHAFLKLIGQRSSSPSQFDVSDSDSFDSSFFRMVSDIFDANKENHTNTQEQMIQCLQLLLDARITLTATPVHEPVGVDEMIFEGNLSSSNNCSGGNEVNETGGNVNNKFSSSLQEYENDTVSNTNNNISSNDDVGTSIDSIITNQEMANALPNREQLLRLVHRLVLHSINPDQDMATIPSAIRTIVLLVRHDYGFRIFHEILEQEPTMFLVLMKRVNETFSADNPDCQVCLLTTLSLLQALVLRGSDQLTNQQKSDAKKSNITSGAGETSSSRSHSLSFRSERNIGGMDQLRKALGRRKLPIRTLNLSDEYIKQVLLKWSGSKEANSTHPITELHGLLEIVSEEEMSLQGLRDGMESLIELLSQSNVIMGNLDGVEGTVDVMPLPQSLNDMFESRGVWCQLNSGNTDMAEEEQFLNHKNRYWFGPVAAPDEKEAPELSRCDLENLAYVCCSGFNLHDELARGRQQDDEAIRHKKRRKGHDAIIHTGRSTKKFVAPMRGRGFGVRSNNAGSAATSGDGRHDSFRSRPPNTSRPPSMHVDDFQKLQKDEKIEEEIMIRERNLRSLRGGRSGIRIMNQGNRTVGSNQGDQSRMPPPPLSSNASGNNYTNTIVRNSRNITHK